MAKRKLPFSDEEDDTLTGYIYDISDVTLSQSGKVKYFTAKFQQDKDTTRKLVSFVPEKHSNFVTAAESDSPVKLKNVKLSPGNDGNISVIVQKNSEITVSAKSLPFKKALYTSPVLKAVTANEATIPEIKQNGTEDMKITVHAKFLGFTEDSVTVKTRFGDRIKRSSLIADANDTIKLTVWGDLAKSLEQGNTYKMQNLCIKKFEGELLLNTVSTSSFIPATEITTEVNLQSMLLPESKEITITHLQIQSSCYCINKRCNAPIKTDVLNTTTYKCQRCTFKMNSKLLTKTLKTTVFADDEQYNIPHSAMEQFLTAENRIDLMQDVDRLEDFLLDKSSFTLELSPNSTSVLKVTTK